MWIWLRATHVPLYDTYWTIKGEKVFEKMFKRKPFSNFEEDKIDMEVVRELMKKEFNNVTTHFGEGWLNPSTIACIFAEMEKKLENEITI